MKKLFLPLIFIAALHIVSLSAQPQIYLVRHAEKLDNWPGGMAGQFQPLSAEGLKTADRLAAHFEEGQIKAVFSSATTRTLHTAFPVAQKMGLQPQITRACSDTSKISEFLQELQSKFKPSDTVLIVSHSNIVPYFLIKSGLSAECQDAMGFSTSTSHTWLLTDFYGELFYVADLKKANKSCGDFKRIKF